MYGKFLNCNRKLVEAHIDDMLKAQRRAGDRIVHVGDGRVAGPTARELIARPLRPIGR